MNAFAPVAFFAASDLVVVGSNPEMADYTNPRGHLFGVAAFVVAEDAHGYRVRLHVATGHASEVEEKAARVAAALTARLASGRLPVAFSTWEEARPAYGSEAYDPAEEIALERREAEEEAWA